jgi:hypothetical protein
VHGDYLVDGPPIKWPIGSATISCEFCHPKLCWRPINNELELSVINIAVNLNN